MQTDGLWLAGIGTFLLAITGITAKSLRLNLQFGGIGDARRDRLAFATTGVGLIATTAGSIMVAIGSSPAVGFVCLALGVLLLIGWLLLAWQVRLLWLARRDETAMKLKYNQDLAREAWQLQAAILLPRWSWALCHPLTRSDAYRWPYDYLTRKIGDEPPGVPAEWYSPQGIQLRRNKPNLVRIDPADAPDWLRDVAAVAVSEGWIVLRTGTFIVFYTPDGLQYETVDGNKPHIVQGVARMVLLRRLKEMGLPMHYGQRGQPLPGHDTQHLLSVLVVANDGRQS